MDAAPGDGESPVLDQGFDGDSLSALRAAAAAHAREAGLSRGRASDLVVAVHELAANAVRHGAGHGRLRLWKHGRTLLCQVSDDGAAQGAAPGADGVFGGARAEAAAQVAGTQPGDAAQWPCEPGHGLWLVLKIADRASLRSGPGGTVATVSFTLPGGAR